MPAHIHCDIRFLFTAEMEAEELLSNAEAKAIRWIKPDDIHRYNNSPSILRMVLKTRVVPINNLFNKRLPLGGCGHAMSRGLNNGLAQNDQHLNTQKAAIEAKLKNLKIRHGLGEIEKETFDLIFEHLKAQLDIIVGEQNQLAPKISSMEKLIEYSFDKLNNLSEIWVSSDLEGKRRLQKTLFPDGIYYNVQKHSYLTKKMNSFIALTSQLAQDFADNKKMDFPG